MTVTEFLEARIAEDEAAARAAIGAERPGTHWQWVTVTTDTVVAPGELGLAQQEQDVSLRTVEVFPTQSVGPLPFFVTYALNELHPGAGEHIARWDPARVLAECAAKRAIVDQHERAHRVCATCEREFPCPTLEIVAAVYADHPEYDKDWAL